MREEKRESEPERPLSRGRETNLENEPEKLESEPEKPTSKLEKLEGDSAQPSPPGNRVLKRKASTVKSNLERVYREKQHLEGEVESLRQCFSRSLRRGSVACIQRKQSVAGRKMSVVAMADNQVEAIRTLQELLQRADSKLKESNAKISRLEDKNAETDERLKESELLQHDLRHAVVISHNFATEESEKSTHVLSEKEELLKRIASLEKENLQFKHRFSAPTRHSRRELMTKTRSMSDESSYLAESESAFTQDEGESDFFSSRHSSVASESDFVRSPPSEGAEDPDEWPKHSRDQNGNIVEEHTSHRTGNADDTDEETTSRTGSTFDVTDTT